MDFNEEGLKQFSSEKNQDGENLFFPDSRTITKENFDKLPRDLTFDFGMGRREDKWSAQIRIRGGQPSITLLTNNDIRGKIDIDKLDNFNVAAGATELTFPKDINNKLSSEQDNRVVREYYIDGLSPRKLEVDQTKIERIDALGLAQLIDQVDGSGLIFYTGAGISMGGEKPVWGMTELREKFGLEYNGDSFSNVFINPDQNPPSEILARVREFGNQLFEDVSTPAHVAMADIVRAKTESVIVTENIDLKHEAEGSRLSVIHAGTEEAFLKIKLRSSKAKMLITAGLSIDDRAIIEYLKQQNPDLKIVAFALSDDSIPEYVGENDAVIIGDIQEILPQVATTINEKSEKSERENQINKNEYSYLIDDRNGLVEVKIEIDGLELQKINQLAEMFSRLTDDEFRENISRIKELSPFFINQLKGVVQNTPHKGIDAYDHTFNTFDHLDTSNNTPDEKIILRMSLLLHDIGKIGAFSREHARWSEKMVTDIISKVNLSEKIKSQIRNQVKYHDFLGDVSRDDKDYMFFKETQALELFENLESFNLHHQITVADVASIPGIAAKIPNIEKKYGQLKRMYFEKS